MSRTIRNDLRREAARSARLNSSSCELKCPNARCVVSLVLPDARRDRAALDSMATFQAAPEADATTFASPLEFLQAMLDSEEAEVAEAARAKMQEGAEEEDAEEDDGGVCSSLATRRRSRYCSLVTASM